MAGNLLRLIEAKSGLKIELAAARWPVGIERALRHQIDAVVNADKTPKRQERLLYTRPYYQVPQAIVVREQHAGVATPAGLATQRVAVMARTSQVGYLRRPHPHVEIVEAQTMLDLMSAVLSGQADLLITPLPGVQDRKSTRLNSSHY